MSLISDLKKLGSSVWSAITTFADDRRVAHGNDKKVAQEWFNENAKPVIDSIESGIKEQVNKYEEKHNLLKLFELEENAEGISGKLELTEEEAKKCGILLANFYTKSKESDADGKYTYELNDYGKALDKNGDGILSADEVKAINLQGLKDGYVSQLEINAFKAKVDAELKEKAQPTDLMAFFEDEESALPATLGYVFTEEGKAQMNHDSFLLSALYEYVETEDDTGGAEYKLNKYGLLLAGEDGKISKEELLALDKNGDGKVTKAEFDTWANKMDAEMKEQENPTTLTTFLDKNEQIKSPKEYADTEEGKAQEAHDKLLLDALYKKVETEDGKIKYEFNEYAQKIAGEDGIIDKNELMKLDKNGDKKVTAKEVQKYKTKSDAQKDINTMRDAWHSTNLYNKLKSIFKKK